MALGLVGIKRGMSLVFTEQRSSVPVTVIEVLPHRLVDTCKPDKQGYLAARLTWGERSRRLRRPQVGCFDKAGVEPGRNLREFRLEREDELPPPDQALTVALFRQGQKVDVSGITIGKGFAGTIKRWKFKRGGSSHGTSLAHRSAGSIGQCQTPGRVFKGKKMAGHMGNVSRTVQNLEVVRVDPEHNLLLVKGAVPGPSGSDVVIRPAIKQRQRQEQ